MRPSLNPYTSTYHQSRLSQPLNSEGTQLQHGRLGSKQVKMQLHDSQRTMRSMTGESQEGSQDIDTFAMQSAMDQHKKSVRDTCFNSSACTLT